MSQKHMKKWWIWGISLLLLFSICLGCGIYLGDYYHADLAAIATVTTTASETELAGGHLAFVPPTILGGFIFYPGGKVEHTAYVPLMRALASHGILCILVKMPFRLAVFDMNAADGIQEQFSQVENWYIGGHSLGGAMAASYLEKNHEDFDGLVLLGAYSTADLSGFDLDVLSVYGSEDGVMDRAMYEECKNNLPRGFTESLIDGGCHAYFGMYGLQDGDGTPTVTNEEQIIFAADRISEMISNIL